MLVKSVVLLHSERCRRGKIVHHWHQILNDTTVLRCKCKCFAHLILTRHLTIIEARSTTTRNAVITNLWLTCSFSFGCLFLDSWVDLWQFFLQVSSMDSGQWDGDLGENLSHFSYSDLDANFPVCTLDTLYQSTLGFLVRESSTKVQVHYLLKICWLLISVLKTTLSSNLYITCCIHPCFINQTSTDCITVWLKQFLDN